MAVVKELAEELNANGNKAIKAVNLLAFTTSLAGEQSGDIT